jgi:hypothetical protein
MPIYLRERLMVIKILLYKISLMKVLLLLIQQQPKKSQLSHEPLACDFFFLA